MRSPPPALEAIQVLRNTNPWWEPPHPVRPAPPKYRRPGVAPVLAALSRESGKIQVMRGPRQVGKSTAILQMVEDLLRAGHPPREILYVRFDLEVLREEGLRPILSWYSSRIRKKPLGEGRPIVLLLDEIHKLPRWNEEVKDAYDTHRPRMAITGSSSVLVARGTRESLAGRAQTTTFPPFSFREIVEMAHPSHAASLPRRLSWAELLDRPAVVESYLEEMGRQPPQRRHSWNRLLSRYYQRGGYPDLHTGAVEDDRWADHLVETVFERVLGVDIPELFPIDQPRLLRHLYLEVARQTGREISQRGLAEAANAAGYRTNQPTVGSYLHYLSDAFLIREFRRFPLSRKSSAKTPAKITLTDLGIRNALFRGAVNLWEGPGPEIGPLVETLVQTVLRGPRFEAHFYKDLREKGRPRSGYEEVDFVLEEINGTIVPIEVKFQRKIRAEDAAPVLRFRERFRAPMGILVTRQTRLAMPRQGLFHIPLLDFLLAF